MTKTSRAMTRNLRAALILTLAVSPLMAQQTVAPTDGASVGPAAGATFDNYNISQSWELGYRFASIGGDEGKYRSDVNYRDGVRLLSSSLLVHSLEGHGKWFDEIALTTAGLGNDPYQSATFRIQKNRLYRYDMLWRSNDYFNPGLVVASGEHLEDTTHRWQDHDLTLFPMSAFRIHAGYGRTTEDGPALTTEQAFTTQNDVFPVFSNVREQYNEYRLGFDARFKAFRLTVQRRWEYFKDDSTGAVTSPEPGTAPAALTSFQSSQPYRGRTPSWMGNLIGEYSWIAITARASYAGGSGDFVQNEIANGLNRGGTTQNQQIAVSGTGERPALTGDFNITLFPSSRLTVVNSLSVADTRMVGNNEFTEINNVTLAFSTINFQYLGIRLLTNSTDVRYRFTKKFDAFGGFRYADRLIRSTEDAAAPGVVLTGLTAEQSNHTAAGVAGVNWLPMTGLRFHFEGEVGRNDNPFTPISLRNYQALRASAGYRRKNLSLGGAYRENYNNNSIVVTSYSSHARTYSADASWATKSGVSFDASYSKLHLDTIGGIAFFAGSPFPSLTTGADSIYVSNIHALNIGTHFAATKRADLYIGYSLTKDTGDGRSSLAAQPTAAAQIFYNVQTFPLTYQTPLAHLSVRISEKLRWNVGYQYYGYHEEFGLLAAMQNSSTQSYRAHTGYTSLLWSF
jgi:hypothetical protein